MSDEPESQSKNIKVVDRRRFTADGDVRDDAPADAERPKKSTPSKPRESKPPQDARSRQPEGGEHPTIDFMSFVVSLATNAMAALGALPPEAGKDLPLNPDLAREYIDILSMLQEKTRGNLTPQEDQALQRIITDLRLNFVKLNREGPPTR